MHSRALGAVLVAAIAAASPAFAQDLTLGSKAPALSVEEWLKGTAVTTFQPGEIYVVEFWATWCGPCLTSIPHLTELQAKYAKNKVHVLGIAGSERAKTPEAARAKLVKFVEERGDTMAYAVAYDTDQSMSNAWMVPAKQEGIPTSFVVDGTGTIAWIGHPMEMDEPLAAIVAGKWDLKAEAAKAKAAAELEAKFMEVMEKADAALTTDDWAAALVAIDEGVAQGEALEKRLVHYKVFIMFRLEDYDGAYAYAEKSGKGVLKDDGLLLNGLAWMMVDPERAPTLAKKNYDLAQSLAERAVKLGKGKDFEAPALDTLATVHFAKGEIPKAIEVLTRAVELMKGKPGVEEYVEKLESYKKAGTKG